MPDPIRILIADDHPVVRQGLAGMLIPRNGMQVVGEATNGLEAVELAHKLQPDVIMMDMMMPELNGAEATARIIAQNPSARILILTSFGEPGALIEAIHAGALGCLLKDSQPDDLLSAIRSVYRGQMSISQALAAKLMDQSPARPKPETVLTEREREIVALVAEGLANKEIARRLSLSPNTVRSHVSSILQKLNLTNRTQLAVYARDHEAEGD